MTILELKNITKTFGGVAANDGIDLDVREGEVHCLLGENGAGKTTLMKILYGLYAPDEGGIYLREQPVDIRNPAEAMALGIGMIHQNFMLVDRLTVAENIVAGCEPSKGFLLDLPRAEKEVGALADRYGFKVDTKAKIEDLSIGQQQRIEILKALHRNADILILDEPTSVLTPPEVAELFSILKELKAAGKTIIFITHKLKETMAVSDRTTVLRDGRKIGTVLTGNTRPEELARMMVGREVVFKLPKSKKTPGRVILEIKNLSVFNPRTHLRLNVAHLELREGEIVGVAGVEGNGQLELEETLMGLRRSDAGEIILDGFTVSSLDTAARRSLGMVHIPSDRLKRGLISTRSVEKNLILGSEGRHPFSSKGLLKRNPIENYCTRVIDTFNIRCRNSRETVQALSGGNQQKVIIGRELSRNPKLVIAAQPTRGVDIGAVEYIHKTLLEMRDRNKAVLLISAELDELMALSDRIVVLYGGEMVAEGSAFSEATLGLLMAGQPVESRSVDRA